MPKPRARPGHGELLQLRNNSRPQWRRHPPSDATALFGASKTLGLGAEDDYAVPFARLVTQQGGRFPPLLWNIDAAGGLFEQEQFRRAIQRLGDGEPFAGYRR